MHAIIRHNWGFFTFVAAAAVASIVILATGATSSHAAGGGTVLYHCDGQAVDGWTIRFGPSGSSYDMSHLPETFDGAFDASASEYVIDLSLSDGSITCSLTIQRPGHGAITASSTASGIGGAAATVALCNDGGGRWENCS